MGITRVAKVFAILSALLNVGLVFYITQHWVPNDAASVGGAMIKTNGGKHFSFEVYDENDIVSDAVKQDGWERNVVASLNEYFQVYSEVNNVPLSKLTFIDIGANIGWLSFNMAALGVNVLAFEPMQENIELFKKTLHLEENVKSGVSDRITLYEYGLGAQEETCFVYSDDKNVGDGHIQCVEQESDVKLKANYSVRGRVPLKRLDDAVNVEGMHIVVVRMDTEGYEAHVLEGGSKVLLRGSFGGVERIVTEFVPEWVIEKGGDPVKFMKHMTDAGYRAPKQNWGYMKKRDMLNMTNFGSEDVTFHSRKLVDEFMGE